LNLLKLGKILLTIARLTPWKGVALLIEAMPDLIKKYGRIKLVVVGRGSEEKNLKHLAKNLKIEDRVIFTGKAERQEVNDYLAVADVFLLNTNYEGMSHTLLEALKAGLPIITTPAGGNPETIENGVSGLLVGYNDQVKLTEAIGKILADSALAARLAQNARVKVLFFNKERMLNELINILELKLNDLSH